MNLHILTHFPQAEVIEEKLREFFHFNKSLLKERIEDENFIKGLSRIVLLAPFLHRLCMGERKILEKALPLLSNKYDGLRSFESLLSFHFEDREDEEFLRSLRLSKYSSLLVSLFYLFNSLIDERTFMEVLSYIARKILDAYIQRQSRILNIFPPAVLGLGKLGAGELNFSSDIDISLAYPDSEEKNSSLYMKLASSLAREFSRKTPEGFLYRVDFDLRPGGRNSPLAVSASAFINFYLHYGTTYERYALLRAIPAAGDVEMGEKILNELKPFVFRKYLDFYAFREIEALKRKIREKKNSRDDIKLGEGGIRELEFSINTLQIVFGGRKETLRTPSTYEAIESAGREGLISEEEKEKSLYSYNFLRAVENRIQMFEERQTSELKSSQIPLIAFSLGYSQEEFLGKMKEVREFVSSFFSSLFSSEKKEKAEEVIHIEGVEEEIKKISEIDEELASLLLKFAIQTSSPKTAVIRFSEFMSKAPFKKTYISLFKTNTKTFSLLLELFATSRMLTNFFLNHPEMIDSLVLRTYARPKKSKEEMEEELDEKMRGVSEVESFLDELRLFKKEEFLRISIADLSGAISGDEVRKQLTDIAEIIVERCAKKAEEILFLSPHLKWGIACFGKLGSKEMDYFSDLDLLFLFSTEENLSPLLEERTKLIKWAQRVISFLTIMTKEGKLYDIDMRLRPSGRAGPLVVEISSLKDYYMNRAEDWEILAFTRSRFLTGNAELKKGFDEIKKEILLLRRREIPPAAKKMIERFEKELSKEERGGINIKYGRGGLKTIEFILEMGYVYFLWKGYQMSELEKNRILNLFVENGIPSREDAEFLSYAYEVLSEIERKLRCIYERALDILRDEDIERLSISLKGKLFKKSINEMNLMRERVREIFDRIVEEFTK